MRKYITPIILGAAVFCVSLFFQKFTLTVQENTSLFLLAPDYLREIFNAPLPLSHLLGNFLAQFYRFSIYGPAITAVEIVLIYLLARYIRHPKGPFTEIQAVAATCVAWFFTARADDPAFPAAILLFAAAAWLLSMIIFKKKQRAEGKWWHTGVSFLLIAAVAVMVITDKDIKRTEITAEIEQCAIGGDWSRVAELASPEFTKDDPETLPYALLALSELNQLSDKVQNYRNVSPESMEGDKASSYRGYLAGAILYDELGSHNEAVHRIYQASDALPHGSSLLMLRMLVRHYYEAGDYTLMRKYCEVLSRSTLHGQYVSHYLQLAEGKEDVPADSPGKRAEAKIMTHDHATNLLQLEAEGIHSDIMTERFLCSLLLSGNIEAFRKAMGIMGIPTP